MPEPCANCPPGLPCEFVEERGYCSMEHGWLCTVCKGWFSSLICDGETITNRWWQPAEDCMAALALAPGAAEGSDENA